MSCYARQYNDQMQCGVCGLAWDVKDPEPPTCCPKQPVVRKFMTGDKHAVKSEQVDRRFVTTAAVQIPVTLPDGVAQNMARAYEAHTGNGGAPAEAMRAAYRVFMDWLP